MTAGSRVDVHREETLSAWLPCLYLRAICVVLAEKLVLIVLVPLMCSACDFLNFSGTIPKNRQYSTEAKGLSSGGANLTSILTQSLNSHVMLSKVL
jgi:hypothetical protein